MSPRRGLSALPIADWLCAIYGFLIRFELQHLFVAFLGVQQLACLRGSHLAGGTGLLIFFI